MLLHQEFGFAKNNRLLVIFILISLWTLFVAMITLRLCKPKHSAISHDDLANRNLNKLMTIFEQSNQQNIELKQIFENVSGYICDNIVYIDNLYGSFFIYVQSLFPFPVMKMKMIRPKIQANDFRNTLIRN